MDRVVAARKLLAELEKSEQIEVRRAEIVGRDLAKHIEALGRPPSGRELEDWLGEHPQVTELYAGPTVLDELVYRHLTPPPPVTELADLVDARHPELERQLREDPDSEEAYQIYADWLQEQGDPLGELIALGIAARGSDDTRFERFLKLHEVRFLGGLARQLANRVVLDWRHGMVRAIEEQLVDSLAPPLWAQLLELRVCGFLQSLTLHRPCSPELDAAIHASASQSLRALAIDGTGGLPAQLLQRNLRSLAVSSALIAIGPNTLPASLERLELRAREITSVPMRLSIRELQVVLTPSVAAFLGTVELPALTHLAICDELLEPAAFDAVAKLPLAARVTSLALTNVELTDDRMRAIAHACTSFTSLAELDLSNNELTRDGLAIARTLAPTVVSRRQHRSRSGMERRVRRFAGSRLQVAEEIADPKWWRRAGVDGDIRWARYRGEAEYELFVSADLARYGCSCPSSYQPCKHVVALALLGERTTLPEAPSEGIEERVLRST